VQNYSSKEESLKILLIDQLRLTGYNYRHIKQSLAINFRIKLVLLLHLSNISKTSPLYTDTLRLWNTACFKAWCLLAPVPCCSAQNLFADIEYPSCTPAAAHKAEGTELPTPQGHSTPVLLHRPPPPSIIDNLQPKEHTIHPPTPPSIASIPVHFSFPSLEQYDPCSHTGSLLPGLGGQKDRQGVWEGATCHSSYPVWERSHQSLHSYHQQPPTCLQVPV